MKVVMKGQKLRAVKWAWMKAEKKVAWLVGELVAMKVLMRACS